MEINEFKKDLELLVGAFEDHKKNPNTNNYNKFYDALYNIMEKSGYDYSYFHDPQKLVVKVDVNGWLDKNFNEISEDISANLPSKILIYDQDIIENELNMTDATVDDYADKVSDWIFDHYGYYPDCYSSWTDIAPKVRVHVYGWIDDNGNMLPEKITSTLPSEIFIYDEDVVSVSFYADETDDVEVECDKIFNWIVSHFKYCPDSFSSEII